MNFSPRQKWFIKYGAKILIAYSILYLAFNLMVAFKKLYWLQLIEATAIHTILRTLYPNIQIYGHVISNIVLSGSYSTMAISIDGLCLGIIPIIAFASMILALPAKFEKKAKALVFGIIILFIANLSRIIISLLAGAYCGAKCFDLFHLTILKYDLFLLVIILFLASIKLFIGKEELMKAIENPKNQAAKCEL